MRLDQLIYDDSGLIPAVIQDEETNKVLMVGYMNAESLGLTLNSKKVHFFSRSRKALWQKGETSGNYLLVRRVLVDCDGDALLVVARPTGPICHTGEIGCFENFEPLDLN